MKKVKAFCWLLIIGLIVLVVLQNKAYFWAPQSLGINLYFSQYNTSALPNGTFIVISLLIGFLVAYFISLPERFKARKTIKQLSATNAANRETLEALKHEIEKRQQPQIHDQAPDQVPDQTPEAPAGEAGEKTAEAPAEETLAPDKKTDKAVTEKDA